MINTTHSPARPLRTGMRAIALIFFTLSMNVWAETMQSNIKKDENIVFFRTEAAYLPESKAWQVPVHGWVYEEEKSWFRKNAFSRAMERKYGLTLDDDNSVFFGRRTGLLIADNERNKSVVIELGGQQYKMPKSEANGHFKGEITISQAQAVKLSEDDVLEFAAALPEGDEREFSGEFRLLEPGGRSVISDIDDTVKITGVTQKKDLLDNTFYREFAAVPGMAALYRDWAADGWDIHFISSSPWQLYPELVTFAEVNDFPWASFFLKSIRFKDTTILNLFKEGSITKPIQITGLMERFPHRHFILVGDSGEQDPEAYTLMKEQFPERIGAIYIRNVTDETIDNERFSALTERLPESSMFLFDDPQEVRLLQRQREQQQLSD